MDGNIRQSCRVDAGLSLHILSYAETAQLAQREPGAPASDFWPRLRRRRKNAGEPAGSQTGLAQPSSEPGSLARCAGIAPLRT